MTSRTIATGLLGVLLLAGTHASAADQAAASCAFEDVKAAVDAVVAAGGGTVRLPAGSADWGKNRPIHLPGGVNIIGAGIEKTTITCGTWGFTFNKLARKSEGKPFRLSRITFRSNLNNHSSPIKIFSCVDFRIDHCEFILPKNSYAIHVQDWADGGRSRGVVDHCRFICANPQDASAATTGYYGVTSGPQLWPKEGPRLEPLGTENAVFVEDCYFWGMSHAVAGFCGGYYVFRHNEVTFSGGLDAHGWGSGSRKLAGDSNNEVQDTRGTRGYEIYNNTFHDLRGKSDPIRPRSGGGVIFGNRLIKSNGHGITLALENRGDNGYPGPDQIHYLWIWDNEITLREGNTTHEKINSEVPEYIREGRDYFLRAPDPSITHPDDALVPGFREPDYKPYTYPHPLVADGR